MNKALITGITRQDGLYLVELLLDNWYEVHGLIRHSRTFSTYHIDHIYKDPHNLAETHLHLHRQIYRDIGFGL